MAYQSSIILSKLENNDSFKNSQGKHECVELVRGITNAPHTSLWRRSKRKVLEYQNNEILPGTPIATFDNKGQYPLDGVKHAAIYLSHDPTGIIVYDQWNNQGKVKKRKIHNRKFITRNVNDANAYYVIE